MGSFDNIKVGDKVGFRSGLRNDIFTISEVTKVTPKCFDVGRTRYYKVNGSEKTGRRFYCRSALPVTPEFLEAKAKAEAEDRRQKLAESLSGLLYRLPVEKLKAIKEIVVDETDTAQHKSTLAADPQPRG